MLDFQLKVKSHEARAAKQPFGIVKGLCDQLEEYGYNTVSEERENGTAAYIKIAKSDVTYLDLEYGVTLSPNFIQELAAFTEKAYVQYMLDELMERMAAVGWEVSIENLLGTTTGRIQVSCAGKSTYYASSYREMLQLAYDLDVAEVDHLIGAAWPQMAKDGWKRLVNTDCYAFADPEDKLFAVGFNDPEAAKKVVEKVRMLHEVKEPSEG